MELRVLHRDRKLPGERRQERRLVLARRRLSGRVGGEQSDDLVAGREGNRERRSDAGLPCRRRNHREPWVTHEIRDLEHGPVARGAERDVEQPVGDVRVGACEATARRLLELALARAAEVDGHAFHAEELGHPLDGRLERVGNGELRRRLRDHLEQRPRTLELERQEPRPLAGAERVGRADAERRE